MGNETFYGDGLIDAMQIDKYINVDTIQIDKYINVFLLSCFVCVTVTPNPLTLQIM